MNALVVGAGAVGQVFARHLHLGGNRVTFLVRERRAQQLGPDLVLYPLNRRNSRKNPIRFSAFEVTTDLSPPEDQPWDQIYTCVPSTALNEELLDGISRYGGSATIVKVQPGLEDRSAYVARIPDSQLVTGMLSIMSYLAPLSGEEVPEPGMAYWFPPLIKSQFSGPEERVRDVVDALQAGGLPAATHQNVDELVAWVLAVEAPLTAGLECAGWSIQQFRGSRWLTVANQAVREASDIVASYQESTLPALMKLINPLSVRLALVLAPKRRPIPLEAYLEHHFTKVRDQSLQHLGQYIEQGQRLSLPVDSLQLLQDNLLNSIAGI